MEKRPVTPYIYLTIGDLFNNTIVILIVLVVQ